MEEETAWVVEPDELPEMVEEAALVLEAEVEEALLARVEEEEGRMLLLAADDAFELSVVLDAEAERWVDALETADVDTETFTEAEEEEATALVRTAGQGSAKARMKRKEKAAQMSFWAPFWKDQAS